MDEYRKNKEADWEPYYLTADVKRTVEVYSTFRDNKYVVVRKGYEHPEIAMKILSVLFDHSRYEAEDADEMNTYFALNVDPTARPLMINVDYNEATYIVTKHIREVLYSPGDEKTREDLSAIEASYFDACKEYLEAEVPSVEAWAAYKSRISAVGFCGCELPCSGEEVIWGMVTGRFLRLCVCWRRTHLSRSLWGGCL